MNSTEASSSTGLVFAIFNIGSLCALPFTGPTNDSWDADMAYSLAAYS